MYARMNDASLTDRLVNGLHVEAMVLADEVRAYFDEGGRVERDRLSALERVSFSCESLKVTTRLMHVIGWLLTRRTMANGGVDEGRSTRTTIAPRRLGEGVASDAASVAALPETARALIAASLELYARVARLEAEIDDMPAIPVSPARTLLSRLERSF